MSIVSNFSVQRFDVSRFLERYKDREVYFVPNPGNAGDAAIAWGTYCLLDRIGLKYRILKSRDMPPLTNQLILFGGGGNLIEGKYTDLYRLIKKYIKDNECIILPHTIHGYDDIVSYVNKGNLTIFCREETSYNICAMANEHSTKNIYLSDDLAFQINPDLLLPYKNRKGEGVANCFRIDSESAGKIKLPRDNMEISFSWNGPLWHDRELTESVVRSLLIYLSRFEVVHTDRLHVAILSTLINRTVYLYSNSYYKNFSIYKNTLRRYPNVFFNAL